MLDVKKGYLYQLEIAKKILSFHAHMQCSDLYISLLTHLNSQLLLNGQTNKMLIFMSSSTPHLFSSWCLANFVIALLIIQQCTSQKTNSVHIKVLQSHKLTKNECWKSSLFCAQLFSVSLESKGFTFKGIAGFFILFIYLGEKRR